MRILAIGDIHGSLPALRALAAFVPFHATDTLVGMGDYVDRGPDSRGVIDWLLEWGQSRPLVTLRGNHELMMARALENAMGVRGWLELGGMATVTSYQDKNGRVSVDAVPASHREFLAGLLPYWETETHLFVHGFADPARPMPEQDEAVLFWQRVNFEAPPHVSGKHLVCGHTPQRDGLPHSTGHVTCIDTMAWAGGWLTALDVATGNYWQAKNSGKTRQGRLGAEEVAAPES